MTHSRGSGAGPGPFRTAAAFVVGVLIGLSLVLSAVSTNLESIDPGGLDGPVGKVLIIGLLGLFVVTLSFVTLYQVFALVDQ